MAKILSKRMEAQMANTDEKLNAGTMSLSVQEAAYELGISFHTVHELCKREDFPNMKIGRRILIPRKGLDEWLNTHAKNIQKFLPNIQRLARRKRLEMHDIIIKWKN